MNYSLSLQSTYQSVHIALCEGSHILESTEIPNHESSSQLIPHIDRLLKKNNLSLHDCSYLAASQGPGPFTTLRTILATLQGIHCATDIPLIGVDGLKGLITRYRSPQYMYTVALLNAFNNELYYAIASQKECTTGYGTIEQVITLIKSTVHNEPTLIIGNGIALIQNHPQKAIIDASSITFDPTKELCTIADIVTLAWAQWTNKEVASGPLLPLYLKKHAAERI